jgi:hypothetical protein
MRGSILEVDINILKQEHAKNKQNDCDKHDDGHPQLADYTTPKPP